MCRQVASAPLGELDRTLRARGARAAADGLGAGRRQRGADPLEDTPAYSGSACKAPAKPPVPPGRTRRVEELGRFALGLQ